MVMEFDHSGSVSYCAAHMPGCCPLCVRSQCEGLKEELLVLQCLCDSSQKERDELEKELRSYREQLGRLMEGRAQVRGQEGRSSQAAGGVGSRMSPGLPVYPPLPNPALSASWWLGVFDAVFL